MTGISRSLLYHLMSRDAFPRPVRIGARCRLVETGITGVDGVKGTHVGG